MDYPIWLALEDFLPVLLGGAGFALLASVAPRDRRGLAGAALITAGGLAKCAWKLTVATGGGDPRLLEQALFPLMAAGAALLCSALAVAVRLPSWPFAVVLGVAVAGSLATGSPQPIFVHATLGVTAVSVLGAVIAGRHRQWPAVSLFVLGLVLVTSLVPLRGSPRHETLAYQWLEQSLNTSAQAALLVAAWLTVRVSRSSSKVGART